jgi:response regulator RpfG family c-di-GMP phosphodiesterase
VQFNTKRCYKEPWPLEKVLALLEQEKGNHFEPKLVDLVLENIEEILEIQRIHAD